MYKLIIVDDEEEVRRGIINNIDWAKYDFEVINEAENGQEALDLIDEVIPDVLITDICMPLMDGLELTTLINKNYPTIKVVVITGFEDFSFAQKAIKYGVTDYILKPILPNDIYELIKKLKNSLDKEIQDKEDIIKLQKHYTDSLPILKDSFLTSLILGNPDRTTIMERTELFKLRITGKLFTSAVINITGIDELKKFSILTIVKEILERHNVGEAFSYDNMIVILLAINNNNHNIVRNKLFSLLSELRQTVEKFLKVTITLGLGSIQDSENKFKESYRSALSALEYRLILGENKIIFVEDLEPSIKNFFHFDEEKEEKLISSIKFGDVKEVSNSVEAMFENLQKDNISIKEYQVFFMEILSSLLKLARLFQIDSSNILPDNTDMYVELSKFKTILQVKEWLVSFCINLMKNISLQRANKSQIIFEKASDYILTNYSNHELSVQKLADYLYISPSYLNLLFKKESGTTFLKYLINIRLTKAKDLLKSSPLSISAVAEKVGYPDVSYFSYFFKKNIGKSPREFKNESTS